MTSSIFLVDDDQNILVSVSIALESEGFEVFTYTNGIDALDNLDKKEPNLIILDIKMPKMDGLETLHNIREAKDVPVIFLTSKDDEEDELLGLRSGADDYITKPFSQKLLIARIQSILRREELRKEDPNQPASEEENQIVQHGDLYLDMGRHLCRWKGNKIQLTVTEFFLLKDLVVRIGSVRSREQLMKATYDESVYIDDRAVVTHIKRLRQKFKKFDPRFARIETLYGVGYRFSEDIDGIQDDM